MEWVIAIFAIGCLFFAFQVVMDYVKYKSLITPRIQRLEAARQELSARIEALRQELGSRRDQLGPAREEIDQLEREYLDLKQQIQMERERQRPGGRGRGTDSFQVQ
jgi:DNA repair exonuclease SbcCD ATPase subunit